MSNDYYVLAPRSELLRWAKEWQVENDPGDGTDCITPFDKHLHGTSGEEAQGGVTAGDLDVLRRMKAAQPRTDATPIPEWRAKPGKEL